MSAPKVTGLTIYYENATVHTTITHMAPDARLALARALVPECAVVPREATREMVNAGAIATLEHRLEGRHQNAYSPHTNTAERCSQPTAPCSPPGRPTMTDVERETLVERMRLQIAKTQFGCKEPDDGDFEACVRRMQHIDGSNPCECWLAACAALAAYREAGR